MSVNFHIFPFHLANTQLSSFFFFFLPGKNLFFSSHKKLGTARTCRSKLSIEIHRNTTTVDNFAPWQLRSTFDSRNFPPFFPLRFQPFLRWKNFSFFISLLFFLVVGRLRIFFSTNLKKGKNQKEKEKIKTLYKSAEKPFFLFVCLK